MFSINDSFRRRLGFLKRKLRLVCNVTKECVPVYVGKSKKRFVVPLKYFSSQNFQSILDRSAEDLGGKFEGPIVVTCDVKLFKEALKQVRSLETQDDDGDDQNEECYYNCSQSHSRFLDMMESFNLQGRIVST